MPKILRTRYESRANSIGNDRGVIAGFLYLLTTRFWNEYLSIMAIPLFRGRAAHKYRDCLILLLLMTSVGTFVIWPYLTGFRWLFAGFATHRLVDHLSALVSLAFFDTLREPNTMESLPRKRLQRLIVTILVSYVELLFSFSILFLWIDKKFPQSFCPPIDWGSQAFFLSMTTMTTVGYGNIVPKGPLALFLCTTQSIVAVIIIIVILSNVIGLKQSTPRKRKPEQPQRSWIFYLLPLCVLTAFCWVFFIISPTSW